MTTVAKPKNRDGFRISIICASTWEHDAIVEMLDGEPWDAAEYRKADCDPNTYRLGHIGPHNVVIILLPGKGIEAAASASASMRSSFRNINLALVVGVCGGVPTKTDAGHILLGDVIISEQIIQFTFGRQYDNKMKIKHALADSFGRPNKEIRAFLGTMRGKRARAQMKARSLTYLVDLCSRSGFESSKFPGVDKDIAFPRNYRHKHQQPGSCATCAKCQVAEDRLREIEAAYKVQDRLDRSGAVVKWENMLNGAESGIQTLEEEVKRAHVCVNSEKLSCEDLKCDRSKGVLRDSPRRKTKSIKDMTVREPEIHFGTFGSGGTMMNSGYRRDELAEMENIVAFEMEGAGVWDNLPTVVIKSVCHYADSHQSRDWQGYAAANAAACMKAFLMEWTPVDDASDPSEQAPEAHISVPAGSKGFFLGQEQEIKDINQEMSIGDTFQKFEFADRIREKYPGCSIFWIQTTNLDDVERAFYEIALLLKVPGLELPSPKGRKSMVEELVRPEPGNSSGKWLLIVDNGDDYDMWFGKVEDAKSARVPLIGCLSSTSQGTIGFTTRNLAAAGDMAPVEDMIKIGKLGEKDAMKLLEKHLSC